mmetsp:Transcript_33373/g.89315  ORF Transcript_33373/g.89315 Transcript_33373/m.89315 type:complete len:107 (+) Transcript_33373:797-1117(+)
MYCAVCRLVEQRLQMHCAGCRLVCARPLQSRGELVLEHAEPSVTLLALVDQQCLEMADGSQVQVAMTTCTAVDVLPTLKLMILWEMDESWLLVDTVLLKRVHDQFR